jgi:hypothetical protein
MFVSTVAAAGDPIPEIQQTNLLASCNNPVKANFAQRFPTVHRATPPENRKPGKSLSGTRDPIID